MDKKIIWAIFVVVLILVFILKLILDFLDISFVRYGIYLYWVIAIMILLLILPQNVGEMFSK